MNNTACNELSAASSPSSGEYPNRFQGIKACNGEMDVKGAMTGMEANADKESC